MLLMPSRLVPELTKRIATKEVKSEKYIREQMSKRATRHGVSTQAYQVYWATRLGFGTSRILRELPGDVRNEVQRLLAADRTPTPRRSAAPVPTEARGAREDPVRDSIHHLLRDEDLRRYCIRVLMGRGPYDTVIREATVVLDDRLKRLGNITEPMNPADVVGKVINPDPNKAILVVSTVPAEQEGFHSVCKGLMLAFRNPVHHRLSDKITREQALKICAFVDAVLGILEGARVAEPRRDPRPSPAVGAKPATQPRSAMQEKTTTAPPSA
jgi:hypothetical protein